MDSTGSSGTDTAGLNFQTLYAGMEAKGEYLTADEKRWLEETAVTKRKQSSQFGGITSPGGPTILGQFLFFLQSIYAWATGNSTQGFSEAFGKTTDDAGHFGHYKQAQDFAASLYIACKEQGGNLARYATDITSANEGGPKPPMYSWNLYSQVRTDPKTGQPEEVRNPYSVSLDRNYGSHPNGTAIDSPGLTPGTSIPALTQRVS